jgi:hypothetical protein
VARIREGVQIPQKDAAKLRAIVGNGLIHSKDKSFSAPIDDYDYQAVDKVKSELEAQGWSVEIKTLGSAMDRFFTVRPKQ